LWVSARGLWGRLIFFFFSRILLFSPLVILFPRFLGLLFPVVFWGGAQGLTLCALVFDFCGNVASLAWVAE